MTDWTVLGTALITAASAIAGAGLGYIRARYQANVEITRLKMEQGEEHLRHRQAIYHDFFDSAHRFHQAQSVEPFSTVEDYQVWVNVFEHRLVGVSLFGTEEAWHAAQRLADTIYGALGERDEYDEKHRRARSCAGGAYPCQPRNLGANQGPACLIYSYGRRLPTRSAPLVSRAGPGCQ